MDGTTLIRITTAGRLLPLLSLIWLTGCSIIPGMRMDSGSFEKVEPKEPEAQVVTELRTITPQLIAEQKRQRTEAPQQPELVNESVDNDYHVGAGDVLSVTVWDHPELTIPAGEFRTADAAGNLVNSDGTVFYPYIGTVSVAGLTISQIRDLLTDKLRHYVKNPQLDIRVAAYRSKKVFITGEVMKPNVVPLSDIPLTVVEAINLSGGAAPDADLTDVRVTRNNQVHVLDLLSVYKSGTAGNFILKDGDQIYVPDLSDSVVFVMGEVSKPIAAPMKNGHISLAQAILAGGGINDNLANPSRIYVIRGGLDKPSVFQLDAGSADAMLLATAFELNKQDVVYVSPAAISRWNRLMSQILPTVQALWQTNNLIQTTK